MSIFLRIKEERERLGLNQTQLAALAGATKKTQIRWEQEAGASPSAEALAAWAKIGADVQYIVTGEHSSSALSADERELLDKFRAAPLAVKAAAIGALTAGAQPTEQGGDRQAPKTQIITGSGHRVAGRNYYGKE